jgi:hypothetical protein
MIRDLRYKYIKRLDSSEDEFYDLEADPQEKRNVIEDPKYGAQVLRMQREMLSWYQSTCDVVPLDFDKRFNEEMMWSMMRHNAENQQEEKRIRERIQAGDTMPQVLEVLRKMREEG